MIIINNIRELNKVDADVKWAIVRSLKYPIKGVSQMPSLSPSKSLFYDYLNLKNLDQWNKDSFNQIYVPRFLTEIKNNPLAIKTLGSLYEMDCYNKTVSLSCFCTDESFCHRSIIAGLLQGVNANVKTENDNDYSDYYRMFCKI